MPVRIFRGASFVHDVHGLNNSFRLYSGNVFVLFTPFCRLSPMTLHCKGTGLPLTVFCGFTIMVTRYSIVLCHPKVTWEVHMPWEKPSFIEVNMNSEIGAYQDEFDERHADDAAQARTLVEQPGHVAHPVPPRT